jgi:hypothetical protein
MNYKNVDIHFQDVKDGDHVVIGGMFGAIFENIGTTPANDLVPSLNVAALAAEPDGPQFIGQNAERYPTYLGPKDPITIGPKLRLIRDVGMDHVVTQDGPQPYIWGWVTYRDMFPNTKEHLTEFCVRLSVVEGIDATKSAKILATSCKKHNCADEWCQDYEQIVSDKP